jgi:hypothetical protein
MAVIRHGSVTVFFDMAEMARGKDVKFRLYQQNGESVDLMIKGTDLLGALVKMSAVMNERIDVLQRELEKVQI